MQIGRSLTLLNCHALARELHFWRDVAGKLAPMAASVDPGVLAGEELMKKDHVLDLTHVVNQLRHLLQLPSPAPAPAPGMVRQTAGSNGNLSSMVPTGTAGTPLSASSSAPAHLQPHSQPSAPLTNSADKLPLSALLAHRHGEPLDPLQIPAATLSASIMVPSSSPAGASGSSGSSLHDRDADLLHCLPQSAPALVATKSTSDYATIAMQEARTKKGQKTSVVASAVPGPSHLTSVHHAHSQLHVGTGVAPIRERSPMPPPVGIAHQQQLFAEIRAGQQHNAVHMQSYQHASPHMVMGSGLSYANVANLRTPSQPPPNLLDQPIPGDRSIAGIVPTMHHTAPHSTPVAHVSHAHHQGHHPSHSHSSSSGVSIGLVGLTPAPLSAPIIPSVAAEDWWSATPASTPVPAAAAIPTTGPASGVAGGWDQFDKQFTGDEK